ncbi:hypothetical protein TgHK011_008735 [Trichoderma gracile]|nr:hypothetical protein TgHK011_008735 [Trichoderma gracile]
METKDGSRAEVPVPPVCPWSALSAPVRSLFAWSVIVKRADRSTGPRTVHVRTSVARSLAACQRPARPLTASTDERPRASHSLLQRPPQPLRVLRCTVPVRLVLAPAQPSASTRPTPTNRPPLDESPALALPIALGTRLRLCPCCLPPSQRAGQVQVSASQKLRAAFTAGQVRFSVSRPLRRPQEAQEIRAAIHKPPSPSATSKTAPGRLRQHAHSSAPPNAALAPIQCLDLVCAVAIAARRITSTRSSPNSVLVARRRISSCALSRRILSRRIAVFGAVAPQQPPRSFGSPSSKSSVACDTASQAVPMDDCPRKRLHRDVETDDDDDAMNYAAPAKRPRTGSEALVTEPSSPKPQSHFRPTAAESTAAERARDLIQAEFCQEILLKHQELRLINQELAKCQIALEQLRRCHLIPYPVNCPTPQQMLDVSDGKGPAVVAKAGDAVPRWAPPFGVVDGPYSRHYAKWLIPDPAFDGIQPELPPVTARGSISEGRTTRNSNGEVGIGIVKGRRGNGSQKFESLSSGYPPPKDKAGPCVLTRADGQTVKLVCLDCHRDNFSSTQGFINHCRIAHKRG